MKTASLEKLALISSFALIFTLVSSTILPPSNRGQLAAISGAGSGLLGPYSYSGTLVDVGSGAEVDNLETQGNGGMTVAFWITANSSANSSIITKGMASNNSGTWQISRGTQTVPNRLVFSKEGSPDLLAMRNNAIPIGVRTHFVITYDGSMVRNGVKIYSNGTLLPDLGGGTDGALPNSDAASNLVIGGGASTVGLDGTLEDVRLYNRILTPEEIAELSGNQGTTGATPPAQQPAAPVVPPPATGITPVNGIYTVNSAGGSNTFTTIKECADVVKAGETCLVQAGTYPERITFTKNMGTLGNPITFKASGTVVMHGFEMSGRGAVVIDGFEITGTAANQSGIALSSAQGSKITNNYVHDITGTSGFGIAVSSSDNLEITNNRIQYVGAVGVRTSANATSIPKNITIKGNNISWCGYLGNNKMTPCQGMQPSGSNVLVENNDMSHVLDFITFGYSDHVVIRNNIFHDVPVSDTDLGPHIDGVQGWGNYTLLEGNKMYNVHEVGGNAHFTLFANDGAPRYGWVDSADAIIRYNTVTDIDSSFLITQYNFNGARAYHNTIQSINAKANGVVAAYTQTSTGGKVFNNIFSDAVGKDRNTPYYFYAESFPNSEVDYNLSWKPLCGLTCVWKLFTLPYLAPSGADTNGIFNKDPQLIGSGSGGYTLGANSPAIDKGGPLTKVAAGDSGSGTTLIVEDAGMFQDGWAGISPDWIAVGSPTNVAQISSINNSTKTITLTTSLTRSVGAPVYLFKDSTGRQVLYGNAPDIGANESTYVVAVQPSVPKIGDFNNDGSVNSLDLSLLAAAWTQNTSTYDLNKDSTVNTLDFTIMVQNWTR